MSLHAILSKGQFWFFTSSHECPFSWVLIYEVCPITGMWKILSLSAHLIKGDWSLCLLNSCWRHGCPWKLQISRTGKMEKSSHKFGKLQTSAALHFEQAAVFYSRTTLLLGIRPSSSFWGGMAECFVWEQWACSGREVRGLAYGEVSDFHLFNIRNKFTLPEFPSGESSVVYFVVSFISCSVGDN